MKYVAILLFAFAAMSVSQAVTIGRGEGSEGLKFELLSWKKSVVTDANMPVIDLTIRITNTNKAAIWLGTVGKYVPSAYLKERNPSNLTYALMRKIEDRFFLIQGGYSGSYGGWLKLEPNQAVEITLPIFEQFLDGSLAVKASFQTSFDEGKETVKSVDTPAFEWIGKQGAAVPSAPGLEPIDKDKRSVDCDESGNP